MHPSENPQSLMYQGFGGPLKDAGGYGVSFSSVSMPVPFRDYLILTAIVEGIWIVVGDWWDCRWCGVDVTGGVFGGIGIGW